MNKQNCMHTNKLRITRLTLAFCLIATLLIMTSCAGANSHQIIKMGQDCSQCHSDEKATYDVSDPKGATECGGTINIKTSSDKVVICNVTFTSEDGSTYVPTSYKTTSVSGGEASIDLEEGIWAICLDEGASSKSVLVKSSSSASTQDIPTIEL